MFEEIKIDVEGKELTIDVDFEVLPGQPAILDKAPEDCQPLVEPEVVIHTVFIGNSLMPRDMVDLIHEDMVRKIEEFIEEQVNNL